MNIDRHFVEDAGLLRCHRQQPNVEHARRKIKNRAYFHTTELVFSDLT